MERLLVDTAAPDRARALLNTCCASARWVAGMMARRPFGTRDMMMVAAKEVWFELPPADWLEAFAAHPRIGDPVALRRRFGDAPYMPAQEQSGVVNAPEFVLAALAEENEAYERKFGYIFIVCASGLSAEQMLAMLRERIVNEPAEELLLAAGEQAKIISLRLRKL